MACIIAACGGDGSNGARSAGTEGGPCYPNGTCNAGLSCASNLCVNLATDASPGSDGSIIGDGSVTDSGDAAAADLGFNPPTAVLKANSGGTAIGDADLTCLGTPSGDTPLTATATLATSVIDYQGQTAIAGAAVTAFNGIDVASPFATTSSDGSGDTTIDIPVGTKRFGIKLTDSSALDTLLLNLILPSGGGTFTDPPTIGIVSKSTGTLYASLVGLTRTAGTGIVLGTLRDCGEHEISNFVVTVSSTEGTATPLVGADAFYFKTTVPSAPTTHTDAEAATANGQFMVLQIPATATAYVQMWGYKSSVDLTSKTLTLVGELEAPVLADTAVTSTFRPPRTD